MGVPRQPYERLHIIFYTQEAHTNKRFISCDGHQLYAFKGRSVDLEVEGVVILRSIAGFIRARPASCKGEDLELEGGVNVSV